MKELPTQPTPQPAVGQSATQVATDLPVARYKLSNRMLLLIVFFVTLSGIVIHIPSLIRYWEDELHHRLIDTYMATLVLRMDPTYSNGAGLEHELLHRAGVLGIAVQWPQQDRPDWELGILTAADVHIDLRSVTPLERFWHTLNTLVAKDPRTVAIVDTVAEPQPAEVTIVMDEQPLHDELVVYTRQILISSLVISLITAILVYLSLQWLMVGPIHRIIQHLIAFRQAPENAETVMRPTARQDEIGLLERELARMQAELRVALAQRSRLAALGTAVSKINHDFQSILSTVAIASERLARVDDPTVRKTASLVVASVERAVHLCTQTQDLARGDQVVPRRTRFALRPLIAEISQVLGADDSQELAWLNEVPADLEISADRERLYRVLLNLGRNATEALHGQGEIRITAQRTTGTGVRIEVWDNGPGIPAEVKANLFKPFVSSGRPGGMGLGLATARDLVRAHGGELQLISSEPDGTGFRIDLPAADAADPLIDSAPPQRSSKPRHASKLQLIT